MASDAGNGEEGGEGNDADADRMEVDDNPPQSAQEKQESEQMRMKLSAIEEEEDIPTCECLVHDIFLWKMCAEISSDTSIEAPPSILPQKRYCDITGLEVIILIEQSFLRIVNSYADRLHTPTLQRVCGTTTKASTSSSRRWYVTLPPS